MTKVKEVTIEIESSDPALMLNLFSHRKIASGVETEIDTGISLRYEHTILREAVDFPPLVEVTLILAREVVLPIALGIASSYIYDKIKNRNIRKFRIGSVEVAIDKDQIQEMLLKEIKEKSVRETHIVRLVLPDVPKKELLKSARTLSDRPIIFDGKELPFPDNKVYFADYVSGKVEIMLHIRDEELNGILRREMRLYATVETAPTICFRNAVFIRLILASKDFPSGHEIDYSHN